MVTSVDPDEPLFEWLTTIRGLMQQDEVYLAASPKTITKLRLMLNEKLIEPAMRKPVLRAITGLPLSSQHHLTQYTHSVLIQQIEEGGDYATTIIRKIEGDCKKLAEIGDSIRTKDLYTKRLLSDLPNMRPIDF